MVAASRPPIVDVEPFKLAQVVDAGDIPVHPFDISEAVVEMEHAADELRSSGARLLIIGGDHTLALPMIRSVAKQRGPVAVVHFDATSTPASVRP